MTHDNLPIDSTAPIPLPTLQQSFRKPSLYGKWIAPLLIAFCVLLSYANSFECAFMFDDFRLIHENDYIHDFWKPWEWLFYGLNPSRPILSASFAINYAIGGTNEVGYHIGNVLIHLAASLTLWGLVRRTLMLPSLSPKYFDAAPMLSFVIALIFAVHPLQTQSVTYIVQRGESMMGMFALLSLYCFIRSTEASDSKVKTWQRLAILASTLGMLSKQVMIAMPFLVWFYDRTFISGSLKHAWLQRRRFYIFLFSTGIALLLTVYFTPTLLGAGFGQSAVSTWEYTRSQGGVILHYLRLCVWPESQCLDYAWPVAHTWGEILPGTLSILGLLGLSFWAWFRRSAWGFVGAFFFLILAPSSSIMPIVDLAFEHRMYLSLASVVILVVVVLYEIFTRFTFGEFFFKLLMIAVVFALILTTFHRNKVYESELTMWGNISPQRPLNVRAHNAYGLALFGKKQYAAAKEQYDEALRLWPDYWYSVFNTGLWYERQEQYQTAIGYYERILKLEPTYSQTPDRLTHCHYTIGQTYFYQGQLPQAAYHFQAALSYDPDALKKRHPAKLASPNEEKYLSAGFSYTDYRPDNNSDFLHKSGIMKGLDK